MCGCCSNCWGWGEDTVWFGGSDFGVLRATINKAPLHLAAVSGTLSLHQRKKYYERNDGFVVGLEGTGQKLTFAWGELVTLAEEVMFFGPPRAASREYSKLFAHVWSIAYAKQIYAHIGHDTVGDSFVSYALSYAYLTCSKSIYMRDSLADHDLLSFDENESSNQFFKVVDQMCKRALHATVFQMRDQNQPLIPIACIDSLIHNIPGSNPSTPPLVEQLMPRLWANLCSVMLRATGRWKTRREFFYGNARFWCNCCRYGGFAIPISWCGGSFCGPLHFMDGVLEGLY